MAIKGHIARCAYHGSARQHFQIWHAYIQSSMACRRRDLLGGRGRDGHQEPVGVCREQEGTADRSGGSASLWTGLPHEASDTGQSGRKLL